MEARKQAFATSSMRFAQLHHAFGSITKCANLSGVMKELIPIKEEQTR
jgi:hypothetical protein